MSREFKFRAWHKIKKIMSEPYGLTVFHPNPIGEVCCPLAKDIEIMQWTGLHDKNGKEIYEGDIVRHDAAYFGMAPDQSIYRTCVVAYEPPAFYPHQLSNVNGYELEVIGNVHENPELLNG